MKYELEMDNGLLLSASNSIPLQNTEIIIFP